MQKKARMIGTGAYLPEQILTNDVLCRMVDTSDEWITKRVGISERRINTTMENWEMAKIACEQAIQDAGVSVDEIDVIIGCTASPDYFTPSLACLVQGSIHATHAFAFDISAGCSGFVYAMDVVNTMLSCGRVKTALVVCSESLSRVADYDDRSTCVLFGDASGAVVLRAEETGGILSTYLGADGTGGSLLYNRALHNVKVEEDGTLTEVLCQPKEKDLKMNGREVYKFAVKALIEACDHVLLAANKTYADIKYLITHQANIRIIQSVTEKCGLSPEQVPINIERYGNTSSASMPVLLHEVHSAGKIQKGDLLLFAGMGSGLTYGAFLLEW